MEQRRVSVRVAQSKNEKNRNLPIGDRRALESIDVYGTDHKQPPTVSDEDKTKIKQHKTNLEKLGNVIFFHDHLHNAKTILEKAKEEKEKMKENVSKDKRYPKLEPHRTIQNYEQKLIELIKTHQQLTELLKQRKEYWTFYKKDILELITPLEQWIKELYPGHVQPQPGYSDIETQQQLNQMIEDNTHYPTLFLWPISNAEHITEVFDQDPYTDLYNMGLMIREELCVTMNEESKFTENKDCTSLYDHFLKFTTELTKEFPGILEKENNPHRKEVVKTFTEFAKLAVQNGTSVQKKRSATSVLKSASKREKQ